MTKTLVLLARRLDHGGAERQLVELAKALHAHGRKVHVLLFYAGGVLDAELHAHGVSVSFAGKNGRWDWLGFLWRLTRKLRSLQPTAVYSFLDVSNVVSTLLWPWVGRPKLVWSVRAAGVDMKVYDAPTRWASRVEAWLSRFADVVIANSMAGKDWAISRGFPPSKLQVIENGTDTSRFSMQGDERRRVRDDWGFNEQHCVVGLVARIDPMKDHAGFLAAAAILVQEDPSWRIVCIGGGPSELFASLQSTARDLGLADHLLWTGARPDVPQLLCGLDIACSSSRFGEGFSNTLAEAMASGVPCVATDVGDSARLVGEFGELVPAGDHLALAAGMRRLRRRLQREPELRKNARQHIVSSFSLESMVRRTEALIQGGCP
jgi:glycosyltransferase involved in cell wall biosynthesis